MYDHKPERAGKNSFIYLNEWSILYGMLFNLAIKFDCSDIVRGWVRLCITARRYHFNSIVH